MELRRRLYARGGSHETTIPTPLLFALDLSKKHLVRFVYDDEKGRWYLEFEELEAPSLKRGDIDSETLASGEDAPGDGGGDRQ